MKRILVRQAVKTDEENPYWISFSDLMSALLVIFILAVVVLIMDLTKRKNFLQDGIEDLEKAEQVRQDILNEAQFRLKRYNIVVEIADNHTVIRIPEKTLNFKSGDDKIQKKHKGNVLLIGKVLYNLLLKEKRYEYLDTIFLEGHTDSVPIGRRYLRYQDKGNWGLSTDRAISLWQIWKDIRMKNQKGLKEIKNAYQERLFSVSGYASSRRVVNPDRTSKQREKNRRIDIRFTVKRPSITRLKKIKSLTEGLSGK